MKNITMQKRLDKIQATIRSVTNPDELIFVFEHYDVPDFDHAVKRAYDSDARRVAFVPLHGDVQSVDIEPACKNKTFAFAFAFKGMNPTDDQLRRLVKWGERNGGNASKPIVIIGKTSQSINSAEPRGIVTSQHAGKVGMILELDSSSIGI